LSFISFIINTFIVMIFKAYFLTNCHIAFTSLLNLSYLN